jgi:hypothetical protein
MDIKSLFNLILLAITVTTILITIVSFIIFKLRQVSLFKSKSKLIKLESTFFHRYAPHIELENNKIVEEDLRKRGSSPNKRKRNWSLGALIIFIIVLASFFFEDHYNYRRAIQRRVANAKDFRQLVKHGMLKSYNYSPSSPTPIISNTLSGRGVKQASYLKSKLNKKSFCIYSHLNKAPISKLAQSKWISFFNRHSLSHKVYKRYGNYNNCLWIFPHIFNIRGSELRKLKKNIQGKNIIFTGGFAQRDGFGKKFKENFLLDNYYLNFVTPNLKSPQDSMIIVDKEFGWDTASGRLLNWQPINRHHSAILTKGPQSISVVDYNSKLLKQRDFYLSRVYSKDNFLWTSLDPIKENKVADLVILHFLAKLYKIPVTRVSSWPSGHKHSVSIVTTIDDPIYSYSHLLNIFKKREIPHTLFTNFSNLKGIFPLIHEKEDVYLALTNVPEDNLYEKDLKNHFKFFEGVRLDMEEYGRRPVKGFLPYKEIITKKILNTINQNQYSYLFGGKNSYSKSPIPIHGSNIYYIPKMNKSLAEMSKDTTLVTKENFTDYMKSMLNDHISTNSHYILKIENSIIKNPILKIALADFLTSREKDEFTNLDDVVGWKNLREEISIKTKKIGKSYQVKVKNNSMKNMKSFKIYFYGKTRKSIKVDGLMKLETKTFKIEDRQSI